MKIDIFEEFKLHFSNLTIDNERHHFIEIKRKKYLNCITHSYAFIRNFELSQNMGRKKRE